MINAGELAVRILEVIEDKTAQVVSTDKMVVFCSGPFWCTLGWEDPTKWDFSVSDVRQTKIQGIMPPPVLWEFLSIDSDPVPWISRFLAQLGDSLEGECDTQFYWG